MPINIILNGDTRTTPENATIESLLSDLGVQGRVAVMINDEIVKRERYAARKLNANDRVEVISVVGGG